MVAVLAVFATHLFGWPRGGFVGVDIFFVISGYLITANLLRVARNNGSLWIRTFYWNRARRILPAATLVLVGTYLIARLLFLPFRASQVGVDAFWASIFMANWHFASGRTDYFAMGDATSPLQHYWSLSVEEQFYFIWPVAIFAVGVVVSYRTSTHDHRLRLSGALIGAVTLASFTWSCFESAASPRLAYLDTFARVWELGVGALLAVVARSLRRMPRKWKPFCSWAGLGLIAASLVLLSEQTAGFPGPWAALPVAGSALAIAAGIDGEPDYQVFLRNKLSVFIGDVSYSLYLVHWPVIVFVGAITPSKGLISSTAVIALTFGLAIGTYRFVEEPLRYVDKGRVASALRRIRARSFHVSQHSRTTALTVLTLLAVGLSAIALRPADPHYVPDERRAVYAAGTPVDSLGPLGSELQRMIASALQATQWPPLHPSMESVIDKSAGTSEPEVARCGGPEVPDASSCTWGSATAPARVLLVGDSIALGYAAALRQLAIHTDKITLQVEAMYFCAFVGLQLKTPDKSTDDACEGRKRHSIEVIRETKPDILMIANRNGVSAPLAGGGSVGKGDWSKAMQEIVQSVRSSVRKVVVVSAPPEVKKVSECYGRASVPSDCVSEVNAGGRWMMQAREDQDATDAVDGIWVDSQPWFCSRDGYCPAFVGSTPTRSDEAHMTPFYATMIYPVIAETLQNAGALS